MLDEGTPNEEMIVSYFESSHTPITTETIRRQSYGLGGTFGIMVPFHSRCYFMIQAAIDLLLGQADIHTEGHINGASRKTKDFGVLSMAMGPPLAQAAIFLRF